METINLLTPEEIRRAMQVLKNAYEKYSKEYAEFIKGISSLGGVIASSKFADQLEKLLQELQEEFKKKAKYLESIQEFFKNAVKAAERFSGESINIGWFNFVMPGALTGMASAALGLDKLKGRIGVTSDSDVENAISLIAKSARNLVDTMTNFSKDIMNNGLPREVQEAINNTIHVSNENIKEADEMQRQNVEKLTKSARDAWNDYKNGMKNIAMIK